MSLRSVAHQLLDSPFDGNLYGRENGAWVTVPSSSGGMAEAPTDGQLYGRRGSTASWLPVLAVASGVPASPAANQLWWNTNDGNMYLWWNDGTSTQWVPAVATATPAGGPFLPLAGGTTVTGPVTFSGPTTFSGSPLGMTITNNETIGGALTVGGTATFNGAANFTGAVTLPTTTTGPFLPLVGGTVSGLTTFSLTGGTALSVTGGASLATNTTDKVIIGATALSGKTHIEFNPTNPGGTSGAFFMNRQGGTSVNDAPQVAINTRVDHTSTTGRWSSLAFQTTQVANNYNLWNIYNLTTTNANTSAGSLVGMYSQQVRSSVSSGRGVGQWCHIMENRSQTGLSSSTDGTMLCCEIDLFANGLDDSFPQIGRQFLTLVLGQNNTSGAETEASTGISIVNYAGHTVHYKSMIWADARFSNAVLDTRSATQLAGGNAIWMQAGHTIAFDGAGGNPSTATAAVVTLSGDGRNLVMGTLPQNAANDTAAAALSIPVGGVYRNGSVLQVRVT